MSGDELPGIFISGELPWLIVEHASGVRYYGQVGGIRCLHPAIEGIIVPLWGDIWQPLEGISCPDACWGPITSELAQRLKDAWPERQGAEFTLTLDESRLSDGTEAWFPVLIHDGTGSWPHWQGVGSLGERSLARWLDGRRGWLLMPDNCD